MLLVAREAKFGTRAWPKRGRRTIDHDVSVRWDWGSICVVDGAKGRYIVLQPNNKSKSAKNEALHGIYFTMFMKFDEQLTSTEFVERWTCRVKEQE